MMYAFLKPRLGETAAQVLNGLWYAILVVLVIYSAFEPRAEFQYMML